MNMYGEIEVWLHHPLTSALDIGELLPSTACRFTPGETPPVPTV
jgi:hypothetical protein